MFCSLSLKIGVRVKKNSDSVTVLVSCFVRHYFVPCSGEMTLGDLNQLLEPLYNG